MIEIRLPHSQKVVDTITFSPETVEFFEHEKEAIVEEWSSCMVIDDIRDIIGFDKATFKTEIAEKVLEYFFTILYHQNRPGDCPVMRAVVDRFYDLGLKVEDVFYNCTAFKNVIIRKFESRCSKTLMQELPMVIMALDFNLYYVLSVYSDKICEHEKELELRSRIIEDHVLYSRTNLSGIIIETTDAFCKLSGYSKEELLGATHALLRHPDVDEKIYKEMWIAITAGKEWHGELPNIKKDGSTFLVSMRIVPEYNDRNEIIGFMAFRHDITADELSKIDPLTQLNNRRFFDKEFNRLFNQAAIRNEPLSIILADIDFFKQINDRFGHQIGDDVLKNFAKCFVEMTRSSDICARWGGEEFVVVLPKSSLEKAHEVAERIRYSVETTQHIQGEQITCSLGVAIRREKESIQELFERVDRNLYRAKKSGRNRVVSDSDPLHVN